MKIAISSMDSHFQLSRLAIRKLKEYNCQFQKSDVTEFKKGDVNFRSNPILIKVIEELGELANGKYGGVRIIDVPRKPEEIMICTYRDVIEFIAEKHMTWV